MTDRNLLHLEPGVNYLNVAYLAPQLKRVREVAHAALERGARPWEITPSDFFEGPAQLRSLAARLVGGRPEDFAIVPSVSYGMTTAANALPLKRNQKVVVLQDQFPSNYYPWKRRCLEVGAELRTVSAGGDWTEGVLAALDNSVGVVAVPGVHWTDCTELDLEAVSQRCEEVRAALVIDGTQSIGARPFEVSRVRPDFMVWALYKWCFGPYGLSLLYVDPKWQGEKPLEEGWINREGSDNFAGLVDYTDAYLEGAPRFDMGQKGQFLLVPMAIAALEQILEWGPARIESHNGTLTDALVEAGRARGWKVSPNRGRHFIGLELGGDVGAVTQKLGRERIYASARGTRLRVAPHLHTSLSDIQNLIMALDSFSESAT